MTVYEAAALCHGLHLPSVFSSPRSLKDHLPSLPDAWALGTLSSAAPGDLPNAQQYRGGCPPASLFLLTPTSCTCAEVQGSQDHALVCSFLSSSNWYLQNAC